MDALAPITELEAVNEMLQGISESPVETLEEGNSDVQSAQTLLRNKSREFQSIGWYFNTEEMTLTPNGSNNIVLGSTYLKVTIAPEHKYRQLVERNRKLYDKLNNTYTITDNVNAKVVVGLSWDELPIPARKYILALAGYEFCVPELGAEPNVTFTKERVQRAYAEFLQFEVDAGRANLLEDNELCQRLMKRRI
jgi:hypothetical protein